MKRYVPGKERHRPYYLELLVELPARSITDIVVQFDYVFLKWQEYPPDANHGFYIGSAVVTAWLPVARNYTGLPQDGSLISSWSVQFYWSYTYFYLFSHKRVYSLPVNFCLFYHYRYQVHCTEFNARRQLCCVNIFCQNYLLFNCEIFRYKNYYFNIISFFNMNFCLSS